MLWCCVALFLFACEPGVEQEHGRSNFRHQGLPPDNYLLQNTYLDSLVDSMHFACMRGDSLFCAERLPLFDDTALARTEPGLVVAGFFCDVMSKRAYPARTLNRMQRLADAVNSDTLRVWHDYFIGRHRQNIGDHLGAMDVFLDVLPKFIEMTDTNGIATVSKRIGLVYVRALREPQKALPYLRRAYSLEPNIEDKYDIVNMIEQCYRELELPDSMDWCMEFYEAMRNAPALVVAKDARASTYAAWAAFDQCALRMIRDGQGDPDLLRTRYFEARSRLEAAASNSLLDVTEEPIHEVGLLMMNARALLRTGRLNDGGAALVEAEGILRTDTGQHALASGIYSLLADLHRERRDDSKALHYRDLQLDAMRLADLADERSAMASAMAKAAFDQVIKSGEEQYRIEREQTQAAIERVRIQRIILLLISALILLVAALLVNRYRLKRRLQVAQLRASLSRDLHDDIGSTLSSISILSNVARKKAEVAGDLDAAASLDKISDRSQRLMRNMSDIVWSVDPNKDTLEELLMRMREFATSVLEGAGITHTIDFPQNAPTITLSAETKNNLYLVFKEAINNVVKHANAKHVEVVIRMSDGTFRLVIIDDGSGMDPSAATNGHGGNGVRNMRSRATELKADLRIITAQGGGTKLMLDMPMA